MGEPTGFDEQTSSLLQTFGFDAELFASLRARLAAGTARDDNAIRGAIAPPRDGDVTALPEGARRAELEARGRAAIEAGEVGVVVLAGGMATRFGGVVKASVEAAAGQTFLELKLRDVAAAAERAGGRVPAYLMTSFATDAEVAACAAKLSTERVPARAFPQLISLRLTPEGELFESGGRPVPYAPGHGDLTFALRRAGVLDEFRAAGGKLLCMSNVDNLAATLDAAVIGAHLEAGVAVTAEVVDKVPGDKGGAPARVDDVLQIVEAFRFPDDFDQDTIGVFNTNTFVLDAEAIDRDFDLTWFAVDKSVDGSAVVQFEHLVGQLTAFLPSAFLRVPRDGDASRFLPVKDPAELEARRSVIEAALSSRGAI